MALDPRCGALRSVGENRGYGFYSPAPLRHCADLAQPMIVQHYWMRVCGQGPRWGHPLKKLVIEQTRLRLQIGAVQPRAAGSYPKQTSKQPHSGSASQFEPDFNRLGLGARCWERWRRSGLKHRKRLRRMNTPEVDPVLSSLLIRFVQSFDLQPMNVQHTLNQGLCRGFNQLAGHPRVEMICRMAVSFGALVASTAPLVHRESILRVLEQEPALLHPERIATLPGHELASILSRQNRSTGCRSGAPLSEFAGGLRFIASRNPRDRSSPIPPHSLPSNARPARFRAMRLRERVALVHCVAHLDARRSRSP
jgi:hypothetical protein